MLYDSLSFTFLISTFWSDLTKIHNKYTVQAESACTYRCTVYTCNSTEQVLHDCFDLFSSLCSHINFSPSLFAVPATVTTPNGAMVTGIEGSSLTLQFFISDADPAITLDGISWSLTSVGVSEDITDSQSQHYVFSADKLSLTILQLTAGQEGVYTFSAANSAGVTSESVTVVLNG